MDLTGDSVNEGWRRFYWNRHSAANRSTIGRLVSLSFLERARLQKDEQPVGKSLQPQRGFLKRSDARTVRREPLLEAPRPMSRGKCTSAPSKDRSVSVIGVCAVNRSADSRQTKMSGVG